MLVDHEGVPVSAALSLAKYDKADDTEGCLAGAAVVSVTDVLTATVGCETVCFGLTAVLEDDEDVEASLYFPKAFVSVVVVAVAAAV